MNKSCSLEELYSYLRKFHLSESLYTIGLVSAALKYGTEAINNQNLPREIILWVDRQSKLQIFIEISRLADL